MSPIKTLAVAAFAGLFTLSAAGVAPALAQYRGDSYDNRDYDRDYDRSDDRGYRDYDDGSYPSDQSGGYRDEDDEDGYEDGRDAPDVSYFYEELEDQGTWINHRDYGQVWRPDGIRGDWRPYTRGTWANSEEHGWYWVSDEPFGWATYHYGRWFLDARYGWLWVPGTRWGPAWVAWRSNDEQIGWAPLPPDSYWEHGRGLQVSETIYEGPRFSAYWSFVEPRYLTSPRIYTYCAPRERVTRYISLTRPQTDYEFVNRRIVNRGVPVSRIERFTRTRIAPVRINPSDNRAFRNIRRDDRTINVFRPRLTRVERLRGRDQRPDRPAFNRARFRDVDRRAAPSIVAPGQPGGTTGPAGFPVDRGVAPVPTVQPNPAPGNRERLRNQQIRERQRARGNPNPVFPQGTQTTGPVGIPVDSSAPVAQVPQPRQVRQQQNRKQRPIPQEPAASPALPNGGDALQERIQRTGPQGFPVQ